MKTNQETGSLSIIKTKVMYPFTIMLLGALLLLGTLLLPYASASQEQRDYLNEYSEKEYVKEVGMTNRDAVDISLVEFLKIYKNALQQGIHKETSITCIVIIVIFLVLTLLTLLFTLLKKPIASIIFVSLSLGVFRIIHFDFEDRGVIPSSSYDWGMANYVAYIGGVVLIVAAIWMIVEKIRIKHQITAMQNSNNEIQVADNK